MLLLTLGDWLTLVQVLLLLLQGGVRALGHVQVLAAQALQLGQALRQVQALPLPAGWGLQSS